MRLSKTLPFYDTFISNESCTSKKLSCPNVKYSMIKMLQPQCDKSFSI